MIIRIVFAWALVLGMNAVLDMSAVSPAHAASNFQPPPSGAVQNAPGEYTQFTPREIADGFLALAFKSDLRIGNKKAAIHKFTEPIRVFIDSTAHLDRRPHMQQIVDEYARKIPALNMLRTDRNHDSQIIVRLIDDSSFASALEASLGRDTARALIQKTDAQCMTHVTADADGHILHAESLIVVDQGDDVFLDCAYHELLHAFGLPGHDQRNSWTMLNQTRMVGYLSVYDQILLRLLYRPELKAGMSAQDARLIIRKLSLPVRN